MIPDMLFCVFLLGYPWGWLDVESNSAAVQAVGSILSVIVGTVTIIVLAITWKAVKRQAAAAEEQTAASRALIEAAQQQTKATNDAAAAAEEQSKLLGLQYEQNMAPLIVARRAMGGPGGMFNMLNLTNVGAGAAFGVVVMRGKVELGALNKSYEAVEFSPSTLGAGEDSQAAFYPGEDGCMTVQYRGSDRIDRYTIVSSKTGFWQEHWVRRGTQFVGL